MRSFRQLLSSSSIGHHWKIVRFIQKVPSLKNENKCCLNEPKFSEVSQNAKSNILWKVQKKVGQSTFFKFDCTSIENVRNQDPLFFTFCHYLVHNYSALISNCVHSSWSRGMNIYWQRCAWVCSPNCPHKSFRNFWLTVNSYSLAFLQEWILCQKTVF